MWDYKEMRLLQDKAGCTGCAHCDHKAHYYGKPCCQLPAPGHYALHRDGKCTDRQVTK